MKAEALKPLPRTKVRGWHQRIGSDRAVASLKGLAVVRSAGAKEGAEKAGFA